MKKFKEWKQKIKEDGGAAGMMGSAPANNAGGGNIAGIGIGPAGEPGIKRKKKKTIVMGTIKRNIKENFDNNNVMLKQVLDGLDKVDVAIDTMNNPKTEIQVIKEQPKKSFKEKYHVGESIDAALDKYGNTSFDLKKALNSLKPIEKQVIDMRFNNNMTLGEMGKQLNLSVERVRQILYKSIRLLRHPSKGLVSSSEREKILKKFDNSYGQKQIFFQEPATTYMERIIDLHHEIFFYLIILSVLVL
jgi:RNA polymerase sigma factor (sigma-70 family)